MKNVLPLIVMAIFLASAMPVLALDIMIQPNGSIAVTDNRVLGETSDREEAVQVIRPVEGKELKVAPKGREIEVKVSDKKTGTAVLKKEEIKTTNRLKLEAPVSMTINNLEADEEATESSYQDKYINKIREEKQLRKEERIEVRNTYTENGDIALELQSRNVRAKLNGAQFVYDPLTKLVTLTTPSGNQHILEHMPDQAIARMQAITASQVASDSAELQVGVTPEGDVTYTASYKKPKKFLGLFPREVETEVVLNDATGVVTEEPAETDNIIDIILNALSI